MNPNVLLLINSILLALTLPMAISIFRHLINHNEGNSHIRKALAISFFLIATTAVISLFINYSIYFEGKLTSDLFQVANVRNLIKNTALFLVTLTFWTEKQ